MVIPAVNHLVDHPADGIWVPGAFHPIQHRSGNGHLAPVWLAPRLGGHEPGQQIQFALAILGSQLHLHVVAPLTDNHIGPVDLVVLAADGQCVLALGELVHLKDAIPQGYCPISYLDRTVPNLEARVGIEHCAA